MIFLCLFLLLSFVSLSLFSFRFLSFTPDRSWSTRINIFSPRLVNIRERERENGREKKKHMLRKEMNGNKTPHKVVRTEKNKKRERKKRRNILRPLSCKQRERTRHSAGINRKTRMDKTKRQTSIK